MNKSRFKQVCMIGLGYIGLPTAAMFASRKVNVIGVDINQHAVDTINQGKIHIVEPELDILVHATVRDGYLKLKQLQKLLMLSSWLYQHHLKVKTMNQILTI